MNRCFSLCVCSVRAAEGSALRALKEKLFSHRSELMLGFQQYDHNNAGAFFLLICNFFQKYSSTPAYKRFSSIPGTVSVSEWALVLETVVRLDLPWRTLRPHLVHLAPDGRVKYQTCFEDMEPGIPLAQVLAGLSLYDCTVQLCVVCSPAVAPLQVIQKHFMIGDLQFRKVRININIGSTVGSEQTVA